MLNLVRVLIMTGYFRKAKDQLEDINKLIREESVATSLDTLQKDIKELVRRISDLNNHIKKTNDDFDEVSEFI